MRCRGLNLPDDFIQDVIAMHTKKKAITKREANRNRQMRKRQEEKERKGILKLTTDSRIISVV